MLGNIKKSLLLGMKQYSSVIDCNTTLATSFMEGRKFMIKWGNQRFYLEVGESYNFW